MMVENVDFNTLGKFSDDSESTWLLTASAGNTGHNVYTSTSCKLINMQLYIHFLNLYHCQVQGEKHTISYYS